MVSVKTLRALVAAFLLAISTLPAFADIKDY